MIMALVNVSQRCKRSMLALFAPVLMASALVSYGTSDALSQTNPVAETPLVTEVQQENLRETPIEKQPVAALQDQAAEAKLDETPSIPRSKEPLRVKSLQTPNTSISGIGTGTTPEDATEGRLPSPMPLPFGPDREAGWSVKIKHWVAPAYCHQPTYYEDVMLEHHGHERCPPIQPLLSGARFYSGIFFTPYLAYMRPPLKDIPNTGNYRPGSCAPALRQRAPYDSGAIKVQAAAAATGVLALQP